MTDKLFTVASCEECEKVKEYLKEVELEYEEVDAGKGDGKEKFREFYNTHKEEIKRDSNRTVIFPALIHDEEIFQGLEGIANKKV